MNAVRFPLPPRAVVPALAAAAGVVAAHAVDYALLFPRAGARADHLAATGHAYWPVAVAVAMAAGLVAVAVAAGRGALLALGDQPGRVARRRPADLARLLACQATAFAVLEAGERGVAGLPPSAVLHSPEFWLGLLLQLPVAWVATRLLAAVEGSSFRLAAARRRRVRPAGTTVAAPLPPLAPASAPTASPARPRAPPAAA